MLLDEVHGLLVESYLSLDSSWAEGVYGGVEGLVGRLMEPNVSSDTGLPRGGPEELVHAGTDKGRDRVDADIDKELKGSWVSQVDYLTQF